MNGAFKIPKNPFTSLLIINGWSCEELNQFVNWETNFRSGQINILKCSDSASIQGTIRKRLTINLGERNSRSYRSLAMLSCIPALPNKPAMYLD